MYKDRHLSLELQAGCGLRGKQDLRPKGAGRGGGQVGPVGRTVVVRVQTCPASSGMAKPGSLISHLVISSKEAQWSGSEGLTQTAENSSKDDLSLSEKLHI